jgi:hypothetical protein
LPDGAVTLGGEAAGFDTRTTVLVLPAATAAQAIATARATARTTAKIWYFTTDARGAAIVACISLSPLRFVRCALVGLSVRGGGIGPSPGVVSARYRCR